MFIHLLVIVRLIIILSVFDFFKIYALAVQGVLVAVGKINIKNPIEF